jgi:hypothetical protein
MPLRKNARVAGFLYLSLAPMLGFALHVLVAAYYLILHGADRDGTSLTGEN